MNKILKLRLIPTSAKEKSPRSPSGPPLAIVSRSFSAQTNPQIGERPDPQGCAMSISAIWEPTTAGPLRRSWPALAPVLVAIAYYLGAEAAFAIGTLTQQFAPFWPPNVVLLCAFLITPRRYWPLYIAAAFPAHVLVERSVAMPLPQLLAAFGCNVSVALMNALVM